MDLFTDGLCCFVTILGVYPRAALASLSVSRGFARVCSSGEAMRSMASYGDADRPGPQQGGAGGGHREGTAGPPPPLPPAVPSCARTPRALTRPVRSHAPLEKEGGAPV